MKPCSAFTTGGGKNYIRLVIKNTGNKQVDLARLSIKERDSKYSPTFPHPPERSTLVIVKNSTPGICERSVAVIYENSKRKHG